MDVFQLRWSGTTWAADSAENGTSAGSGASGLSAASSQAPAFDESSCQLVLMFGGDGDTDLHMPLSALRQRLPNALIVGCSSSGDILEETVSDNSPVAVAIHFSKTRISHSRSKVELSGDSKRVGTQLAESLLAEDLQHVLVISDGLNVNGSELADGMVSVLGTDIPVTGGLAGDGPRFERTQVVCNDEVYSNGTVVAVGLYGEHLSVGYGSQGGWDVFGPERKITRSEGNMLFDLDGQSALDLYKKYLGEAAADLPGSALLFPLNIRMPGEEERIVRTIVSVDEEQQAMVFAGDVPEGCHAQFMRANFDRLVDGAMGAAKSCYQGNNQSTWDLALLISCVGRKLVLQQRVEEEVECVREVLGDEVPLIGFYSYGELSPMVSNDRCALHNQTMTITTWREA